MEEILPEEERASVEKLGWELERTVREQKDKQIQYENLQEQLAEMDVVGEKRPGAGEKSARLCRWLLIR